MISNGIRYIIVTQCGSRHGHQRRQKADEYQSCSLRAGTVVYVAAQYVINEANRIFGDDGWSAAVKEIVEDYVRRIFLHISGKRRYWPWSTF